MRIITRKSVLRKEQNLKSSYFKILELLLRLFIFLWIIWRLYDQFPLKLYTKKSKIAMSPCANFPSIACVLIFEQQVVLPLWVLFRNILLKSWRNAVWINCTKSIDKWLRYGSLKIAGNELLIRYGAVVYWFLVLIFELSLCIDLQNTYANKKVRY